MIFRIDTDPDEALRACHASAKAAFASLGPSSAGWITVIAYVAAAALAYWLAVEEWLLVAFLAAVGMGLATLGVAWEARWRGRQLLRRDPHVDEPHHMELTAAGVRLWCAHVDTRITWDAITRVTEDREFYIFVRGSSGGPTLPKRVLDDEQDRALRAQLRDWLPAECVHLATERPSAPGTVAAT